MKGDYFKFVGTTDLYVVELVKYTCQGTFPISIGIHSIFFFADNVPLYMR